jgi:hypothetical protein
VETWAINPPDAVILASTVAMIGANAGHTEALKCIFV